MFHNSENVFHVLTLLPTNTNIIISDSKNLLISLLFDEYGFGVGAPSKGKDNSNEAGATFDNSFFDNSLVFLRQFKNRSFLGSVFVHVTGRSQS